MVMFYCSTGWNNSYVLSQSNKLIANWTMDWCSLETYQRHPYGVTMCVVICYLFSKLSFCSMLTRSTSSLVSSYFLPFHVKCVGGVYSPSGPNSNCRLHSIARDDLIKPTPPARPGPGWYMRPVQGSMHTFHGSKVMVSLSPAPP